MSEHLPQSHEREHSSGEQFTDSHEAQKHLEKLKAEAREAAKTEDILDELSKHAETAARNGHETHVEQPAGPQSDLTLLGTQRELKSHSYERKVKQIRSHLTGPERSFSKIIHQPVIDTASEAGSKTIFRASGILGGSVAALVGSIVLLYASKHYGFRYNYLLFFVLFILGFIAGLLMELVVRVFKRHRAA